MRGPSHKARQSAENKRMTLLLLGHLTVFLMSMLHDEFVAEMVEDGLIPAAQAGRVEVLIGIALFVAWGWLSVQVFKLMQRASAATGAEEGSL